MSAADAGWDVVIEETDDDDRTVTTTDRLTVPGGWLYRTTVNNTADDVTPNRVSMVFVRKPWWAFLWGER